MIKKLFASKSAKPTDERASGAARRYDDLRALFVNCTLKTGDAPSHTNLLLDKSRSIMAAAGVRVESVRLSRFAIAPGVQPDMRAHGARTDDWPKIWEKVRRADILVIGTPIWLGQHSSICAQLIERLYAHSGERNEKGQYVYYGKTGGVLVTGNEDGIKHVAMSVLYSLGHLGFTIPPQADAGWIGEAGPGPSYGDVAEDGSRIGFDNQFTNKNMTIMSWNLIHFARMLKDNGGVPARGNTKDDWEEAFEPASENPEYR